MMQHIHLPIDPQVLRDVVRQAVGSDTATLRPWHVEPVAYHNVDAASRGLHRVRGTAYTVAGVKPWSVVLKMFAAPADAAASNPSAMVYWRREASAYRTGFLSELRAGLRAPSCWQVEEQGNGDVWLWLEDAGVDDTRWSIARYGEVARQLGMFGGTFVDRRAVLAAPWFSRSLLPAWVADAAPLIGTMQRAETWDDPLLRRLFPPSMVADVLELWADRDELMAALARCSPTVCHHDLWRGNLVARGDETVLLDWELVGVGALGEDMGNLLGVGLLNLDIDVADAALLADTLFGAYVGGLRAAGWHGDPAPVAYAFNVAAALRSIFSAAGWPCAILNNRDRYVAQTERRWGRPIEQIVEQWAAVTGVLLQRAGLARTYLPRLSSAHISC